MKVYLLWFNEWEANYVLGIFESQEQAEKWQSYFIANPLTGGYVAPDMAHLAKKGPDWIKRFEIEECTVGQLDESIKIDNLKYVENLFNIENDKKTNT